MPEHIVVVDDEPAIVSAATTALRRSGFDVCGVHSAEDALARLREREFDVAVVDIVMDGVGGMGVVQHIRVHHPGTNIVVMSGVSGLDSAVKLSVATAHAFLPKPFAPDDLRAAIDDVRERGGQARRVAD